MGATVLVQPFDLIKTRMQIAGKDGGPKATFPGTFASVVKNEGVLKLYAGY
jgi:hypothetical protein